MESYSSPRQKLKLYNYGLIARTKEISPEYVFFLLNAFPKCSFVLMKRIISEVRLNSLIGHQEIIS